MKSLLILLVSLAASLGFALPTAQEQQAIAKLSDYDQTVINDYTSLGYAINNGLRDYVDQRTNQNLKLPFEPSSRPTNLEEFEGQAHQIKYLSHLTRALQKIPDFKQTVYRGIYSNENPEQRFVKNRISVERRFNSTTTDRSVADKFARGKDKNATCGGCPPDIINPDPKMMVVLEIESKTGKNISALNPEEKEVLLPYGVILKTKEVFRETNRKIKAPCTKNKKDAICEYTGFLVVKMEELLDSTMSVSDKATLEATEQKRNQELVQKYFDGKPENLNLAVQQNNALLDQWLKQGNSLDQEDLSFDEGGG